MDDGCSGRFGLVFPGAVVQRMLKPSMMATVVVAAVGLPYVVSESSSLRGLIFDRFSPSGEQPTAPADHAEGTPGAGAQAQQPAVTVHPTRDDLRTFDFAEVFNFDHSTPWVLSQWPRVSTTLADLDSQGYRVALVTGTQVDDLAGSLSYYFNREQRIERIEFRGTTGDARRLVHTLVTQHGFQREVTEDPGLYLYQVRDGRNVLSELHIRPSKVIRQDQAHTRFELQLVMRRPDPA